MAFSLDDVINQKSKHKRAGSQVPAPKVQMIHFSKLHKSSGQFYSEEQIDELAEMILLGKGIKQPLLVKRLQTDIGEYEIIAGHRRRLASMRLYEQGHEEYAFLPCIISKDDDVIDKINLILTNRSQRRNLSPFELMEEIRVLDILIREYEEESGEQVTARQMRKEIAKTLGLSETKVANIQNIQRNLSDTGKEKLEKGDINISVATELAGLDREKQETLLQQDDLSVKTVKDAKRSVSDSDTGKTRESVTDSDTGNEKESVSDSDTRRIGEEEILEGQVEISDYAGIAPMEYSRLEKLQAIQTALQELDREGEKDVTQVAKKEAYQIYIDWLRSEIRDDEGK